jgi:hypothetical protein
MKKIILSVAVCTITFIACNKNNIKAVAPEASSETVVETSIVNQRIGNPDDYTTWFDRGGMDYGCNPPSANCYSGGPAIALQDKPTFNDLFEALSNNNSIAIKNVITNHMSVLEKYIDKSDLNYVISGDYNISIKGINVDANRYIIFKSIQKGSIEMVYSIHPY